MTPERLGSRYLLEERIGEGGLGVVWRGRDASTGTVYAIKLLRAEYAQDPATVSRFVRERTALLRFRHPNVVTLYDMIVEGDRLALVMDFIANGDLNAHRQRRGGALSPAEAAGLTAQICSALAAAHNAGIVHRDLKPANVLLDGDLNHGAPNHGAPNHGDSSYGGQVRLTDFGIARVSGEPTVTTKGYFLGTLSYIAPEVIQGGEPTPACDVYAAAVTLYELLAGRPPFTGQAATVIYEHLQGEPARAAGIPDAAWQLIVAGMAKDPARRPSAAELESALRGSPRMATATSGWRAVEPPVWDVAANRAPIAGGTTPGVQPAFSGHTTQAAAMGLAAFAPANGGPGTAGGQAAGVALAGGGIPGGIPALGGTAAADDAGASGGGRPHRRGQGGPTRRAWALGSLAVLVAAGGVAYGVTRSTGPASPGTAGLALATSTATAAAVRTSPAPPATKTAGAAHKAASPPASKAPTTAPPPAPATHSAVPTSAAPTSTGSANTAWQCGPIAPAVVFSTGADSGQKLQVCIRVDNGKLEAKGTLSPTVAGWDEQINFVLKDSAQGDHGNYTSPVCDETDCVFSTTITPPGAGRWTILPEWLRLDGKYQSAGEEPGFVNL
jgi:serine/threonine protein kinase, bacterial